MRSELSHCTRRKKDVGFEVCAATWVHKDSRGLWFSIFYISLSSTKSSRDAGMSPFYSSACLSMRQTHWTQRELLLPSLRSVFISFSSVFFLLHQKSFIWTRNRKSKKQLITNRGASQLDIQFSVRCALELLSEKDKSGHSNEIAAFVQKVFLC